MMLETLKTIKINNQIEEKLAQLIKTRCKRLLNLYDIKDILNLLNKDEIKFLIGIRDGEGFISNVTRFGASRPIELKNDKIANKLAELDLIEEIIEEDDRADEEYLSLNI